MLNTLFVQARLYPRKKEEKTFSCNTCHKDFSTKICSLINDLNIWILEWAIAIFLVANNIIGTAYTKLAQDFGISQKSAWYMTMRIREVYSMDTPKLKRQLKVDEANFGGKESNKHKHKKN